jgi:hypothetical protein
MVHPSIVVICQTTRKQQENNKKTTRKQQENNKKTTRKQQEKLMS